MDELKAFLSSDENDAFADDAEGKKKDELASKKVTKHNPKNIELAKLYNDAYEYEQELASFEEELAVVEAHKTEELASALSRELCDDERDYDKELQGILVATWVHKVETLKTHPQEQLDLIKDCTLSNVVEKLSSAFPEYEGDFSKEVKAAFSDRLKTLVAIKKEHIKEEIAELKIAGLKPTYVKRIYKQVNGISK
ncbi:MAG: hypothetical protein U9Q40_10470 [Campylobacterota bacterium]|nr:hypothetical protein [Campylobacterota bacterium]